MLNRKQMTIEEIEKVLGHKIQIVDKQAVCLKDIAVGGVFNLAGVQFIVLEQTNVGAYVITKELQGTTLFDSSNNNYKNSQAERHVIGFDHRMCSECNKIGLDYNKIVVPHQMSLTALDGRRDYESTQCCSGLLTFQQYREYVHVLDNYKLDQAWFLSTPLSTVSNGCHETVCYINGKNCVDHASIRSTYGIRPVAVFNKDTIVQVITDIV